MRSHHVNFRYILLEDGKDYILVDKLPTLLGYFLPYLNWFSKRHIYRLTEKQFWEIRTRKKHWLEMLVVPMPLVIVCSVVAGRMRGGDGLYTYLSTSRFTFFERWITWGLSFTLVMLLGTLIHFLSSRAFQKTFDFQKYHKAKGLVKLLQLSTWPKTQVRVALIITILMFLSSFFILYFGNILSLLFHLCVLLMSILVSGDLSYSEGCQYKIERTKEK